MISNWKPLNSNIKAWTECNDAESLGWFENSKFVVVVVECIKPSQMAWRGEGGGLWLTDLEIYRAERKLKTFTKQILAVSIKLQVSFHSSIHRGDKLPICPFSLHLLPSPSLFTLFCALSKIENVITSFLPSLSCSRRIASQRRRRKAIRDLHSNLTFLSFTICF